MGPGARGERARGGDPRAAARRPDPGALRCGPGEPGAQDQELPVCKAPLLPRPAPTASVITDLASFF